MPPLRNYKKAAKKIKLTVISEAVQLINLKKIDIFL